MSELILEFEDGPQGCGYKRPQRITKNPPGAIGASN